MTDGILRPGHGGVRVPKKMTNGQMTEALVALGQNQTYSLQMLMQHEERMTQDQQLITAILDHLGLRNSIECVNEKCGESWKFPAFAHFVAPDVCPKCNVPFDGGEEE